MSNAVPAECRRVLLIDDHRLFAESLAMGLEYSHQHLKVTLRRDLKGAIDFLLGNMVDLIILDLDLANQSGLDFMAHLSILAPSFPPPVLLCSAHQRPASIAKAFEWGVAGFICKDQSLEDFYHALSEVLAGRRYCSPMVRQRVEELEEARRKNLGGTPLSPRYMDLLAHLARGHSNRDIAAAMHVSENTVKTYLKDIYSQLGVNSRIACLRKAASEGIIDLG